MAQEPPLPASMPLGPQPTTPVPHYQPPAGYPVAVQRPTNQLAIVSLAAAIASFVIMPFIGALVAIVTGHVARSQIRKTGEDGGGLALAGLVIGYVHLALFALLIIGILVFALGLMGLVAAGTHQ
jgi:hypothetical protein